MIIKIAAALVIALVEGTNFRSASIPSHAPQAVVGIETSLAIARQHLIKPIATQDTLAMYCQTRTASYIDVLDSKRSRFNVELTFEQSRNNEHQSPVQFYKALGGGW
ncbi:hypothetical protein [Acidicapsa acidisoli]|uniref:hypothetical protein n=1 Tax=Acidicapsa acidisoli TaxID=1615681 RepID=UPI0021E0882F|nr:hypothetical protein [Acidicapsa acidisoli]